MHKQLKDRHLLLDTNLLIKSKDYTGDGYFDEFFGMLENLNVKSVIEEATRFEFLRGSKSKAHLHAKEEYLNLLLGKAKERQMILPLSDDILKNARMLANIYSNKNGSLSRQISATDCLIAAQLMKYEQSLLLATLDNDDFPLFIFDRIGIHTIDAGKEILNIGIYKFNSGKFSKCKNDFEKA